MSGTKSISMMVFRNCVSHGGLVSTVALVAALTTVATVTAADRGTQAAERESPVAIRISNPKPGRLQVVNGVVNTPGRPVILVRADKPNEPWWVQGQAVPGGPRGFSAKAVFGNERTVPGSSFRVVAILVDASDPTYVTGRVLKELPDVPTSDQLVIRVVATGTPNVDIVKAGSEEAESQPRLAEITSPKTGADVQRVTDLAGRIESPYRPVVLVRPLATDSAWYVQKAPQLKDDGTFSVTVVFGSSRTPRGRRFRMVVLALKSSDDAAKLKPGTSLREIPPGVNASAEVVLTLRNPAPGPKPKSR